VTVRGYHRRARADAGDPGACVLAATEVYVGMTTARADRPAFSGRRRPAELRRLESEGVLESRATRACSSRPATGSYGACAEASPEPRRALAREVDVLRLATRGLTTREIAEQLVISSKTADHHIQHIYTKIGVSTRAAAALWAIQNEVVR